jgi:hypothetical protein
VLQRKLWSSHDAWLLFDFFTENYIMCTEFWAKTVYISTFVIFLSFLITFVNINVRMLCFISE